jgi:hypothetical protein
MKVSPPYPEQKPILDKSHGGAAGPGKPFADNVDSRYQFQHDSVLMNSPEASGVYGLFNALWIYVGEADNIRTELLRHLEGDNTCISRYQPSGFAFEIASPPERTHRRQQLVGKLQPFCNPECSRHKS